MFEWERTIYYDARKDFMNEIARCVESRKAIDRIDLDLEEYEIEMGLGDESVSTEVEEIDAPQIEFKDLFEFEDEDLQF